MSDRISRERTTLALAIVVMCCCFLSATPAGAREFDLTPDQLRESFQDSLKTSAFRPKFDFKAFDFLEALVEQRQSEKWLNLFRLIDEQLDEVRNQMIPGEDGMWMTVGQWCDQLLRDLPPEGLDKIRLYIDSRARQALTEIESTTNIDDLYRLYDRYSVSSYGHRFADHLGDALFESGNYHDAAIIWNKALSNHDATEVSELRIMLKRAIALSRLNSPKRLRHVCGLLTDRFGNQTTMIGGKERNVDEFATELSDSTSSRGTDNNQERFRPGDVATWAWSVYWPELEEAGKKGIPISYAGNDDFSVVHLGYAAAGFDRRTAKLTWIHQFGTPYSPSSSSNSNARFLLRGIQRLGQNGAARTFPAPSTTPVPVATKDRFILRMYRAETVQGVPSGVWTMHCVTADSGKLLWTLEESLPEFHVVADPVALNGSVFVVCTPLTANQLTLNVLDEATGESKWSLPLGSVDLMTNALSSDRAIRLSTSGDRLYVVAGGEVAMSVNTRQRSINWLYQVKRKTSSDPTERQIVLNGRIAVIRGRQIIYGSQYNTKPLSTLVDNLQVFLLDPELKSLTCIDEDTRELRWKQNELDARLLGVDSRNVYVHDADKKLLIAIERETGKLAWERGLSNSLENLASFGDQLFLPAGSSLLVLDRATGEPSQTKVIPEAGEIQRIVRDGKYAVTISRDYVTVFTLSKDSLPQRVGE